jgi:hypothetical protein
MKLTTCTMGAGALLCLCIAFSCGHNLRRFVEQDPDAKISQNAEQMLTEGRQTFRFDTFGSEKFFGEKLRLHEAIAGGRLGGVGPGLSPKEALALGLKVDVDALPNATVDALRKGAVDLDDPAVTLSLLRSNAVVGLTGGLSPSGTLQSVGIQCALCHSTVDNSLQSGIGRRLDGWANRDLDVGQVIALAPNLKPIADLLETDELTVRKALLAWGPGKFDAQLFLDGKAFRPDSKTAATLIPAAFGLAGVNQHTSTGSWGSVTYWNAFVANLEMHGEGTFFDPRLADPQKYPIAAKARSHDVRSSPDRVTGKLAGLHFYQLAIPAPTAEEGSFNEEAAARGKLVFGGVGKCATCHVPPLFTEPGWNLHEAKDIGIDDFQSQRSPDNRYRTTPLKGLWTHQKGGFYHDGRFATLQDVVEHYDTFFKAGMSPTEKSDLVEYLKSL